MTVWLLVLLFAMVTPLCVPGICQKACDATEFDAGAFYSVNLVARKPEKRTPQTTATRGSF